MDFSRRGFLAFLPAAPVAANALVSTLAESPAECVPAISSNGGHTHTFDMQPSEFVRLYQRTLADLVRKSEASSG